MRSDDVFVRIESPVAAAAPAQGLTLQWRNVTLEVERAKRVKSEEQNGDAIRILDDISGFASPGELLVVMGPSGAGKTSLLNVISGRSTGGLSEQTAVTVNGRPWTKDAQRRLSTYVLQDDLFYETLTVREHLLFQARLRMSDPTEEQRQLRVDHVLRDYGLYRVRNSLIGGLHLRGISGGEKKRLSIASEVLSNASIYFVDEPTSGLDSFMAAAVVSQLKHIAKSGSRTVVATIHQPSSEIFAQFDKLYLLAAGQVVYHGRAAAAVSYFSERGYQCPMYLNPSDYFMTQLAITPPAPTDDGTIEDDNKSAEDNERLKSLIHAWKAFQASEPYQSTIPSHSCEVATAATSTDGSERQSAASFAPLPASNRSALAEISNEMKTLASRNVLRLVRDKLAFRVAIMQSLLIALLVGLIYLQLDLTPTGMQSFVGAFFFFTVSQIMVTANGQFATVPAEIAVISREYRGGLYHITSWYLAKNVSELPLQIVLPIIFYVPVYFLIGIGHGAAVYLYQQIIIILLNSTAVGFGYMVSCLSKRVDITPIIGIAVAMPMLLLGGLLVNTDDIPVYLIWVEYISPFKYGFEALMTVFWSRVDSISCSGAATACTALTGEQVLSNFSMANVSAWTNSLLLVAINIAFRLVGFASLAISLNREGK